jgi:hypothetical protein
MRLAYIIVSHFNFEQTLRLFNILNHKDSLFVFHVSKKCEPQYYEKLYTALKDHKNCFFPKRINVIWGSFSLVQAVLNAIDTLIESNVDFDYAFLLSGQDYPIKSHNHMVHTLSKNPGKQYLEFIPFSDLNHLSYWLEAYHFWVGKRRFCHPHQQSDNLIFAMYNFIFSLFLPKNRKLPENFVPYKGSTWWTLTRECLEFLHQQAHSPDGKKIIKYFKNTWHPTESYIQTTLMNSKFRGHIINNDLRFILWSENDNGHPKILTEADYKDIVSSDRLFARKFDLQVDATILDLLDEKIASGNGA